jgi:hypothetical protein
MPCGLEPRPAAEAARWAGCHGHGTAGHCPCVRVGSGFDEPTRTGHGRRCRSLKTTLRPPSPTSLLVACWVMGSLCSSGPIRGGKGVACPTWPLIWLLQFHCAGGSVARSPRLSMRIPPCEFLFFLRELAGAPPFHSGEEKRFTWSAVDQNKEQS